MKLLKNMFVVTLLSFIFSFVCVCAQSQVTWAPVELSASSSSVYNSNWYTKSDSYCTGLYKVDATDALLGQEKDVSARVQGTVDGYQLNTAWKVTVKKSYISWQVTTDCDATTVRMNLKRTSTGVSKVNFWGTWNLKYVSNS